MDVGLYRCLEPDRAHRRPTIGPRTIATLDHRYFDVLRPLTGDRFTILP
jgi:hypothetical protein